MKKLMYGFGAVLLSAMSASAQTNNIVDFDTAVTAVGSDIASKAGEIWPVLGAAVLIGLGFYFLFRLAALTKRGAR